MYPVSTSFIPFSIALVRFWESGNIWGNYPFWYLGEVPFRYLTGPVVPLALSGLDGLFGGLTLFDWSLVLLFISWAVSAFGWGILAMQLSGRTKLGILVGILYFVFPWHIVSSLALSDVSAVVGSGFSPFVLFAFVRGQRLEIRGLRLEVRELILTIVVFAVLLLTNTIAAIPTILGLGILSFVLYKHPLQGLKKAGLVIFLGGLLTIWWYSPGYWLRILFAPSFGGRSVIGSIAYVVDMARALLPVALAFIFVVWKVKPKNNFEKFAYLWLGSFVGLTFVRFVSNVNFWMDWTSWFGEIEVGLVMLIGLLMHSFVYKKRSTNLKSLSDSFYSSHSGLRQPQIARENRERDQGWLRHVFVTFKTASASFRVLLVFILLILPIGWGLVFANRNFWVPRGDIENTVEWQVADKLQKIVKPNETVFLSGTSAFWLNAFADVRQMRGGADQVGLRPELAKTVWEVRMGNSGEESVIYLKKLGVNYLVVHAQDSKEYYGDFENPGKFGLIDSLSKVYDENGDIIYRIK